MAEFGVGMSEYIFCPKGEAVYYKKSWHHASDFFIKMPDTKEDKNVVFKLCPAHEMEKNKQYEGEVMMRDIPAHIKGELTRLIENMGERAMRIDVLDRIFAMKWTGDNLRVITSENQLAQKIGRKIKETFKKHIAEHIVRPKGGDRYLLTTLKTLGEQRHDDIKEMRVLLEFCFNNRSIDFMGFGTLKRSGTAKYLTHHHHWP